MISIMVRDSAATRARILDAAIDEFSAYGLAGARIDRIAEAAEANKRSIYVYFQSKELLFTAALNRVIGGLIETVPLTEDDLPGYAGRTFDYLLAHPEACRLSMWRKLERPTEGPDERAVYAEKLSTMNSPRSAAMASQLPPADLIILVIGLASSWMNSPDDLLSADGSDPTSAERIAVHRAALVESTRRICAAQTRPE
jgi:AcrR family transcriptional regulator